MKRIEKLLNYTKNKEVIYTKDIVRDGLDTAIVKEAVEKGYLFKIKNGLYKTNENFEDMYYCMQANNNIIFSNETALYFHNLIDRTPITISVTVLQGSSNNLLKKYSNIKKYYVKKENYNLGVINYKNNYGNYIKVYDIDRTFVDIVKNENRIDREIYLQGIKNYIKSNYKNYRNALKYARQLKCYKKVKSVISILGE